MIRKLRNKINNNNKKRSNEVIYEHCRITTGGEDR
jgi:hypothetical protein